MSDDEKKKGRSFSLTKGEIDRFKTHAKAHGMSRTEYLLALDRLAEDWEVIADLDGENKKILVLPPVKSEAEREADQRKQYARFEGLPKNPAVNDPPGVYQASLPPVDKNKRSGGATGGAKPAAAKRS